MQLNPLGFAVNRDVRPTLPQELRAQAAWMGMALAVRVIWLSASR